MLTISCIHISHIFSPIRRTIKFSCSNTSSSSLHKNTITINNRGFIYRINCSWINHSYWVISIYSYYSPVNIFIWTIFSIFNPVIINCSPEIIWCSLTVICCKHAFICCSNFTKCWSRFSFNIIYCTIISCISTSIIN